jgi:hypothetical protein
MTDRRNPRSIETKIVRLTREIAQIDKHFYHSEKDGDRQLYAGMLERKRDDMVRSAVLQLHTAIEDILNSTIICCVLDAKPENRIRKIGSVAGKALRKMLFGAGSIGFDMKLNLAVALRVLDAPTKTKLMELNSLRNKCSHNWLLKIPVRHGKRPKQKKPPLLFYRGHDLHTVATLKEFTGDFGIIYAKMFAKYVE